MSATKSQIGKVKSPHRPSKLTLPIQKELVLEILASCGIYKCNILDIVIKKKGRFGTASSTTNADPTAQAIFNKYYNCRRKPEIWERTQIELLGEIHEDSRDFLEPDRSKESYWKVVSTVTPTKTPPRETSPFKTPIKTRASFSSPTLDLIDSFGTMSINNAFGNTSEPHEIVQVDHIAGHVERDFLIMCTPKVTFGTKPAYTCPVLTFVLSNIDDRWLKKLSVPFTPFKMTQVTEDAVVLEYPHGPWDFFFAPRMNSDNEYNPEEMEKVFLLSGVASEQIQYEMQRNAFLCKPIAADPNENWHRRVKYIFKGQKLDFRALDPKAQNGEIKRQFVFGPKPTLKWRLAFKPKQEDILCEEEEEEDKLDEEWAQYEAERKKMIQESKAMKNEGE